MEIMSRINKAAESDEFLGLETKSTETLGLVPVLYIIKRFVSSQRKNIESVLSWKQNIESVLSYSRLVG